MVRVDRVKQADTGVLWMMGYLQPYVQEGHDALPYNVHKKNQDPPDESKPCTLTVHS